MAQRWKETRSKAGRTQESKEGIKKKTTNEGSRA